MGGRPDHQYVILDENGECRLVRDNATERCDGLHSLLVGGWRPIRETPIHATTSVLILLEHDGNDAGSGFGFA